MRRQKVILRSRRYTPMIKKFFTYLKESRSELTKVIWPSRTQTRDHTIMVIAISLAVAIFLGLMDYVLEEFVVKSIVR